jgi:hypothetical protein
MSAGDDGIIEIIEDDGAIFEDPVSQRAYAFVHLARYVEESTDDTARELTYSMMRKLCASIKTASTADLKVIGGGKA